MNTTLLFSVFLFSLFGLFCQFLFFLASFFSRRQKTQKMLAQKIADARKEVSSDTSEKEEVQEATFENKEDKAKHPKEEKTTPQKSKEISTEEKRKSKKPEKEITSGETVSLLRRAEAFIAQNNYDEAKRLLIRILAWEEKNADAGIHLGFLYLQEKDFLKAEDVYRRASEVRPRDASLLTNLAIALYEQEDKRKKKESIDILRRAVKADPKTPERHANLGQYCFFMGDLQNAVESFTIAVHLSPRNIEYLFFLADTLLAQKEYRDAKGIFLNILNISPFHEEAKKEIEFLESMGH